MPSNGNTQPWTGSGVTLELGLRVRPALKCNTHSTGRARLIGELISTTHACGPVSLLMVGFPGVCFLFPNTRTPVGIPPTIPCARARVRTWRRKFGWVGWLCFSRLEPFGNVSSRRVPTEKASASQPVGDIFLLLPFFRCGKEMTLTCCLFTALTLAQQL